MPGDQVLGRAARDGMISFDAPGARYTHRDGLCTFKVLVDDHGIADPAVRLLARIVHGADIAGEEGATPQSSGLQAIAEGFFHLELADSRQLELELPVYDALYAWCQRQTASSKLE